mgnify:CR=1 FL=1
MLLHFGVGKALGGFSTIYRKEIYPHRYIIKYKSLLEGYLKPKQTHFIVNNRQKSCVHIHNKKRRRCSDIAF